MKITALIYHDILEDAALDDSGFPGSDAASYKLGRSQFLRQLEILKAIPSAGAPLRIADPRDVYGTTEGVVLTFDDGGISATDRILQILERESWLGHFFVTTDFIGRPGFVSASGVRGIADAGHVVGTHSASHPLRMGDLARHQIFREWRESRDRLADVLGSAVTVASVPGGFYTRAVAEAAAEAGIRILFTSEPVRSARVVQGTTVLGRFSITRRTPDPEYRRLITGVPSTLFAHRLSWGARKALKRMAGRTWMSLRKRLFDSGIVR